jgi:steroid 5-alpha reductase family enzyme
VRGFIAAFLVAMHDPLKGLPEFENWGAGIWAAAFLGEMIADSQLARFKRDPKNKYLFTGVE